MGSTGRERVLLKLSGESMGDPEVDGGLGVRADSLARTAKLIASGVATGVAIVIVPGGGNIVRGGTLAERGDVSRVTADQMGMLGTMINGLALRDALESLGVEAVVMSAMAAPPALPAFSHRQAGEALDRGAVVILTAGTGHPYFATDTGAALRAAERGGPRVLKATKVAGVSSADPSKRPDAERYETLSIERCIDYRLAVMDLTALTMCRDHGIDLAVFNFREEDSVRRVIEGDTSIATSVRADS